MLKGHGDDICDYSGVRLNFSSNISWQADASPLLDYLKGRMETLRSYPEPDAGSLERTWAESLGLPEGSVCATSGATQAIYLIAQAFEGRRSTILSPTFSEYGDACRMFRHDVSLAWSVDGLEVSGGGLCWICNPNNPTGLVWNVDAVEELVDSNPGCIFVIDHSYAPYTDRRLMTAAEACSRPNVMMLHSMTKRYGVPGLRLGGITGRPALVSEIRRFMFPWSVNALAIEAGKFLISHGNLFGMDVQSILAERQRVSESLSAVGGMELWPSDTNMLLACLRNGKSAALKDFLVRRHGILIRDASNFEGLDDRFFRIAVQRPEEDDLLVEAIREWIYNC